MKRRISLLLALALACSLFSGIAAGAEADFAPVTLKLFHAGAGVIPSNIMDNPVMNQIAQETGVTIDWSLYMGGGTASETASRVIAANELPDIWLIGDTTIIGKLIEYGLVMPLDELVTKAPHVQEIATEAMAYARYRFNTEESYLIPLQVGGVNWYPSGYDRMFSYRYDLWEEMGRPEMKTYDDFIQYLVKCQELEPLNKDGLKNYGAGLPLAAANEWYYIDYDILNNAGKTTYGPCIYDWANDTLSARFADNSEFFQGTKFWYTLNQLGLLDPESATMTLDQTQDKGRSYRNYFGAANWQIGWPNDTVRAEQAEIAKKDAATLTDWEQRILKMGWVPLVLGETNDHMMARIGTAYGNGNYYLISKTCKDPEAAMRYIDYLASYEGAELCTNGPEGMNWHYVDGVPTNYTAEEQEQRKAEGVEIPTWEGMGIAYMAPLCLVNGYRENPKGWTTFYSQRSIEQFQAGMSNGELKFAKDNGYNYGMQYIDDQFEYTTFDYSILDLIPAIEATSDLAVIATDVDTIAYEYAIRMIYARDDAEYEQMKTDFLAELEQVGYGELVNYYVTNYESAKELAKQWGF